MMMGFGFLVLLLLAGGLFAVLVAGVVLASGKGVRGVWADGQRQPAAGQVLDERLARGEIGREEYEAIRAQIAR